METCDPLQPVDVRRDIRWFHRAGRQDAVDERGSFWLVERRLDANADDATCSRNQHRTSAVAAAGVAANFHVPTFIVPHERPHPHHERPGSVTDQHQRIADLGILAKRRLQCGQRSVGHERHHHHIEAIGPSSAETNDTRLVYLAPLLEDELPAITVAGRREPVLIHGGPAAKPLSTTRRARPNDEGCAEALTINDESANCVGRRCAGVCRFRSPDDSDEQDQRPEDTQDFRPAPPLSGHELAIGPQTLIRRGEYWLHGLHASAGSAGMLFPSDAAGSAFCGSTSTYSKEHAAKFARNMGIRWARGGDAGVR